MPTPQLLANHQTMNAAARFAQLNVKNAPIAAT